MKANEWAEARPTFKARDVLEMWVDVYDGEPRLIWDHDMMDGGLTQAEAIAAARWILATFDDAPGAQPPR